MRESSMPAVSTMKQGEGRLLEDGDRQPPSSAPLHQPPFDADVLATPRSDVIVRTLSRDERRPTSGPVTSHSADVVESPLPSSRLAPTTATSSSSAFVSSPETGWRAISGCDAGGSLNRPLTQTSASSPADGEPADVSLTAASPTVARTPLPTSDSGSRSCDPLATLMRLYGTLSDSSRLLSPVHHPRQLDNSPAAITSLPVMPELTMQAGTSVPVSNGDYIMRELNEAEDDADGPTKSYVCHVCQYIGTSRSLYLSHVSEHFKHRCTLCGYMTSYAGRLKRHLEDCHSSDDQRPATTQRKPALKRCRKCGFESTNLKVFYDHARTHIRPERILECPTSSCPFVTEYRHHLELHLRNHLNSRPIRCPICPYRCAVSSMLASHLKSHTKVHRFRCSVCRFSSKFSNALKRHLIEKGHGRGYVLNPDGSIPEGGAVPFEPGSPPTMRLRQKAKPATATTLATSEAQTDPRSELTFATGADIKATIWTPPVTASPEMNTGPNRVSWRPLGSVEELPVKRSPVLVGTSLSAETQTVSVPPLPPLPTSTTAATLRARSLCACAVCGFDASGYVELAQHMMTSHYSGMTSGPGQHAAAAATLFKRRWPADDEEPVTVGWTPPSLPPPQVNHRACHAPPYDVADVRREFLQSVFPAARSTLSFHQPPPFAGLSAYRSASPAPTAFGTLSSLRAELDAVRSSEGPAVRADDAFRMTSHDLSRVKSDEVDAPRRTNAPPNFNDVSGVPYWHKTAPSSDYSRKVESVPVPPRVGLPLDLSTKTSTPRCDHVQAAVKYEAKRSRRKGKAYKVDADRFNSGRRDGDLADDDPVGGHRSSTELNDPWRRSEDRTVAAGDRARGSGGGVQVLAGNGLSFAGDRDVTAPTASRSGESRWSDGMTAFRQTPAATSVDGRRSATASYQECRHCGLGFRDGELFAMHMDFHGRPDPFTCNFCGAETTNQVEFFLHVAHAPHNVRPVYVM